MEVEFEHEMLATSMANGKQSMFDFPKTRKKWAEILLTELADVIALMLTPTGKPLFCSPSVYELLGWKDNEIVAMQDFREIIHHEDVSPFTFAFQNSVMTRSELLIYTRLKRKPPPSYPMPPLTYPAQKILLEAECSVQCFEFKGCPIFELPDDHSRPPDCFLLMAAPHPSRNDVMLDSFLQLRLEHVRLQDRVAELRARAAAVPTGSSPPMPLHVQTGSSPLTLDRGIQPLSATSTSNSSNMFSIPSSSSYHHPVDPYMSTVSPVDPSPSTIMMSGTRVSTHYGSISSGPSFHSQDDSSDIPKKKRRKLTNADQRVCSECGRTDSPEWRKGPLGPKTLCNACGLRFAKVSKRKET